MQNQLFRAAFEVMSFAYVPYSQFPVGAAILTESGEIFSGCNVENASYPEGSCAETSAISNMVCAGHRSIIEIAVVAKRQAGATPCGGCRQRIAEFGNADTMVHLCDAKGIVETITLGTLLPKSFGLE